MESCSYLQYMKGCKALCGLSGLLCASGAHNVNIHMLLSMLCVFAWVWGLRARSWAGKRGGAEAVLCERVWWWRVIVDGHLCMCMKQQGERAVYMPKSVHILYICSGGFASAALSIYEAVCACSMPHEVASS